MDSPWGKFVKHAGFVAIGGAVTALISYLATPDNAFVVFVGAHPYLSFVVPAVAGALGSLAKVLADQAAAN